MGPAKVFEDRLGPGDWRVEWVDVTASYSVMAAGFAIRAVANAECDWSVREKAESVRRYRKMLRKRLEREGY